MLNYADSESRDEDGQRKKERKRCVCAFKSQCRHDPRGKEGLQLMVLYPPAKDTLPAPYLFIPVSVSPFKCKVLKGRRCRGILPAVSVCVCAGQDEGNEGVYLLMYVYGWQRWWWV